jgi:hypothetical protein
MSKHFITNSAGICLKNSAGQNLYEHITLPTEYQEVDYIATSGTQYIDTGYVLKSNKFKVDLIVQFTGTNTATFASYVGFMESSSTVTPRFGIHNYTSGTYMYGADATLSTESTITKERTLLIFNGNGTTQSLSVNGEVHSSTTSFNMSTNTLSMYLGARNVAGAVNNALATKIYRFKLAVNGKKERDLIPCYRKSDNIIGMYDLVYGVFYTNKGSGSFTKGHDLIELPSSYQRVEYISSNTTVGQYIDTGVIPSYVDGFKIDMDFAPTTLGNRYALIANYNQGEGQLSLELNASNKVRFWMNTGNKDVASTTSVTTGKNNIKLYYDGSKYIVNTNGEIKTENYAVTAVPTTSLYLFLDRAKRTTTFTKPLKIYDCKIWGDGELLRHFIPCYRKSDNVIGMYDIINSTFYTNKGTGSFTKGSNISN